MSYALLTLTCSELEVHRKYIQTYTQNSCGRLPHECKTILLKHFRFLKTKLI